MNYMVRAVECVRRDLAGAQTLGIFEVEVNLRAEKKYEERIFVAAWQNSREFGTHRVCVNNNDESMCVHGNYCLNKEEAFRDLLRRAGLTHSQGFERLVRAK